VGYLTFGMGPPAAGPELEPLRRRLARVLTDAFGQEVRVGAVTRYSRLVELLGTEGVQLAWVPPAVYVRAQELHDVRPIAATVHKRPGPFHAAMFVPADSGRDLADLDGASVAWVDRTSCSGYLFPRFALYERGIHPERFFGDQTFHRSHAAVVEAVASGRADLGATYAHLPDGPHAGGTVVTAGWTDNPTPVPMRPVLVTRSIPPDLVCATFRLYRHLGEGIAEAIARLPSTEAGREVLERFLQAQGFGPVEPRDYEVVRAALNVAHLPRLY
jgi:phosphonate transport system substrate-binding protein